MYVRGYHKNFSGFIFLYGIYMLPGIECQTIAIWGTTPLLVYNFSLSIWQHSNDLSLSLLQLSVISVRINRINACCSLKRKSIIIAFFTQLSSCSRQALHLRRCLHQQDKSHSPPILGSHYTCTYACINRIKCLAGPKGLLMIPCIQGIIGWTKR